MSKLYTEVSPSEPSVDAYTTVLSARKAELGFQHKKRRYIRKDGNCNVLFRHVPKEWHMYIIDIFTTLVEMRWRFMFLMFTLSYILSWLLFGLLYWAIVLANGDMSAPCVFEVNDFTGAFLFSLETQTTIGYGFRGMSENCMSAIIVVTVQDVLSCFIDTFVIGIAVAKMASARRRAQTVGFSNCAVINLRNGQLCLSWRVGDFRRHHMVEGTAQAQIIQRTTDADGRVDVEYRDLEIKQSEFILAIPTTVFHMIGPSSPLYRMGLEELRKDHFELVVSFTYTDDSTGILHQTRTSYMPGEILWGQLFQEMIIANQRYYKVDYSMFHLTAKVFIPEVSAEEYEKIKLCRFTCQSLCSQQLGFNRRPPTVTVDLVNDTPEPEVYVETMTSYGSVVRESDL